MTMTKDEEWGGIPTRNTEAGAIGDEESVGDEENDDSNVVARPQRKRKRSISSPGPGIARRPDRRTGFFYGAIVTPISQPSVPQETTKPAANSHGEPSVPPPPPLCAHCPHYQRTAGPSLGEEGAAIGAAQAMQDGKVLTTGTYLWIPRAYTSLSLLF